MSRLHCCEWEPPVVQPERFAQWSRDVQILFKYFPLEQFYRNVRWPGWQEEVVGLSGDQGLSIYPFLWANREIPVEQRSRRAITMAELWMLEQDLAAQLRDLPPGAKFKFNRTEG